MPDQTKVACRTPNPDKPGVTNIPKWKFDAIRAAILSELQNGQIPFADLPERVRARLSEQEIESMGSIGWHTTSVKLELEVRGEIERIPDRTPQILRLPQNP